MSCFQKPCSTKILTSFLTFFMLSMNRSPVCKLVSTASRVLHQHWQTDELCHSRVLCHYHRTALCRITSFRFCVWNSSLFLSHCFRGSEIISPSQDLCWDFCSPLVLEYSSRELSQLQLVLLKGKRGSSLMPLRSEPVVAQEARAPCLESGSFSPISWAKCSCAFLVSVLIKLCLRLAGDPQGLKDSSLSDGPPTLAALPGIRERGQARFVSVPWNANI